MDKMETTQQCPYGDAGTYRIGPPPHGWRTLPNGDRVCNHCGSLHFDDFLEQVARAIDPLSPVRIDASDKPWKFYINRPEVKNASEGAIKFYTPHAYEATPEQGTALNQAVQESRNKRHSMEYTVRGEA